MEAEYAEEAKTDGTFGEAGGAMARGMGSSGKNVGARK